jgi:hypothetical protein
VFIRPPSAVRLTKDGWLKIRFPLFASFPPDSSDNAAAMTAAIEVAQASCLPVKVRDSAFCVLHFAFKS